MELTLERKGGYVLAKTSGPIDDTARELFREQLHPLFAKAGTRLIIDLAASQRINSPGIGNCVALVADANTNGGRVIFCSPQSFVATVLSVTKLDTFFEVTANLDEAVARLREAPKSSGSSGP